MRLAMASLLVGGLLVVGCSDRSSMPMAPAGSAGLRVEPADGASGVRLDQEVRLIFSKPVDRAVVQRNLHLIAESAIADSTCPDSAGMSHPDMAHCMADPAMMDHLDAVHSTPGRFTWDDVGTVCTFRPDAMMRPATTHMIHLGRELMDMLGRGRAGMGDHGSGMTGRDMMLHFRTMDAAGGRHGDHH